MLFVCDIGNSNITLGFYEGRELVFVSRLDTDARRTRDQYAAEIFSVSRLFKADISAAEGAVICSVVPPLTKTLAGAVKLCSGADPLIVGPGIKTGLDIKIENPGHTGADLVATAVAAKEEFETPVIIYDLGTATKGTVLVQKNKFIGGFIAPGVGVSLDALSAKAAQLPHIGLEKPDRVVGDNTIDCMRSGVVYGTASMLDSMTARIEEEIGEKCTVVITGGYCDIIADCCKREVHLRKNLLLEGLRILYEKNRLEK